MPKLNRASSCVASKPIRQELARLVGRPDTRRLAHPLERDWRPTTVLNPSCPDGQPFTTRNCWDFIYDSIQSGVEIEVKPMSDGKTGYVLKVSLPQNRTLYIKLQIGCGYVIGKSFHYSEYC
jgi:hypothetical protein